MPDSKLPSHLDTPEKLASLGTLLKYPEQEILDDLQSRYHLTEAKARDVLASVQEHTLAAH